MKRTAEIEVDKTFEVECAVTKQWSDATTGKRFIRGVASGVAVDRDGERVSRNAIAKMTSEVSHGEVKLTSSHTQDWATEIGDVVKAVHDPKTDEMIVDCALPPEGLDPMADKAWRVTQTGQSIGFSIGGKLRKAYYEMSDVGKKTKVLDDIHLRHVMLTKNPSYALSFAEAVAKTFTDVDPIDDLFTEDVEKADPNSGQDSVTGDRKAGANSQGNTKDVEGDDDDAPEKDPSKGDDDETLENVDARHLACPNCGHEFAADLPDDTDTTLTPGPKGASPDNDKSTAKSVRENTDMPLTLDETLDHLRDLVNKADEAPEDVVKATDPEVEVEKAVTADTDVMKAVAASHKETADRLDGLETSLGKAFELVAKTLSDQQKLLAELPIGRRSKARILPPNSDVEKSVTDADSVEKRVEAAESPVEALKILNEERYGIR